MSTSAAARMTEVRARVSALAAQFAREREQRSQRTALDPADLAALADAGFLLTGVPAEQGGLWTNVAGVVDDYCAMLRELAQADPSLALVAAMHPAVLAFWLGLEPADAERGAWRTQCARFFETARAGHWWGTIISEPGSGGDPGRTRTRAVETAAGWSLSGEKHFGSGAGVTSFMITTALADGAMRPDVFVIDMRGRAWDGSAGLTLRRAWNGHGMMATQSHAFLLADCPVERMAVPDGLARAAPVTAQLTPLLFAAVILGVLDAAGTAARAAVAPRWQALRAFEQVGWTQAANRIWLAGQAFDGARAAVRSGRDGTMAAARAKLTIAELAEDALALLARVVGGASFARSQPFGQWAQDVRALGFLRPPWGFAFDQLFGLDFAAP